MSKHFDLSKWAVLKNELSPAQFTRIESVVNEETWIAGLKKMSGYDQHQAVANLPNIDGFHPGIPEFVALDQGAYKVAMGVVNPTPATPSPTPKSGNGAPKSTTKVVAGVTVTLTPTGGLNPWGFAAKSPQVTFHQMGGKYCKPLGVCLTTISVKNAEQIAAVMAELS